MIIAGADITVFHASGTPPRAAEPDFSSTDGLNVKTHVNETFTHFSIIIENTTFSLK